MQQPKPESHFFKAFFYALAIVTFSYWLPFFFTWLVLDAPWWVAGILAFISIGLVINIESKRTR